VSALAVHPVPGADDPSSGPAPDEAKAVGKRRTTPYLLLLPAGIWLIIFFAVPLVFLVSQSLQEGSLTTGYVVTWNFAIYPEAIAQYSEQLVRSLLYAGTATLLALLIAYPLAYTIAFRAGRWRNLLLVLVIAPFLTSFLIRTLAWQNILATEGPVTGALQALGVTDLLNAVGLIDGDKLLGTPLAVVTGLTYNFLPFMTLPLYASLERIDARMLEAGYDLYGRRRDVFLRVTLPLSMPGVVAGVLLTFIPAAGDFINAELLGTPNQFMIGNVIQSRYLEVADYPTAAALSFLLMAFMLIIVFVWARIAGTEALLGTEEERT
jgi:spermidine/putrescine transport system permease protein